MSRIHIEKMISELSTAGVSVRKEDQWDLDEWYNYVIHQYDITFLNTRRVEFTEQSRSLGANTSRTSTGKFKRYDR